MRISDWSSDVCSSDLLRANALAVGLKRGKLILEDHLGIIEQPADQRRLAVVHRSAGDEAQQRLVLMVFEILIDVFGDERGGLVDDVTVRTQNSLSSLFFSMQIGRRACREHVCQ